MLAQVLKNKMKWLVILLTINFLGGKITGYIITKNVTKTVGEKATLSCSFYNMDFNPHGIVWLKKGEQNIVGAITGNLAIYSNKYRGKVNVSKEHATNFMKTNLTFISTTPENDGCYKCLFQQQEKIVFATPCLTTVVKPNLQLKIHTGDKNTTIICSVTSRPKTTLKWLALPTGKTIDHINMSVTNKDGTTTTTLQTTLETRQATGEFICLMNYMGTTGTILETIIKEENIASSKAKYLTILSIFVVILLIIVMYWLIKYNKGVKELLKTYTNNLVKTYTGFRCGV